ncbi:hypothetical protein ACFYO7_10990 [Nocardia salmonicida]|uniref:hypothetical protein n=1 Tax=Nocardia salmonicida TaxID=53431 RepID=UPI0036AB7FCD
MIFVLAFIVAVVGLLLGGGTGAVLLATTVVMVLLGLVMLGATPEARNERHAAALRRARGRAVSEQARRAKAGGRTVGARSNGSGSSGD